MEPHWLENVGFFKFGFQSGSGSNYDVIMHVPSEQKMLFLFSQVCPVSLAGKLWDIEDNHIELSAALWCKSQSITLALHELFLGFMNKCGLMVRDLKFELCRQIRILG